MEFRPKSSILNLIGMILIAFFVMVPIAIADEEEEQEDHAPVLVVPEPAQDNMLRTGSLGKQIPIQVPPGRSGMTPKVSLQYSSSNKQNGWLGVGWSDNIGYIQRSEKHGVDYGANEFVIGGSELVPVFVDASTGGGEYRAKIESAFTKFNYNPGSGWTAQFKDGTVYSFGLMPSSRLDNPYGVFRWYLCKVEDSNGNFIVYDYEKDAQNGAVYPLKISYTYNGETDAFNRVEFVREGRADLIPSYITHTKVITAERLQYINTYANEQLVSQYVLHYDYGGKSGRSRLIRVQLYGSDGTTSLPATIFDYTEGGNGDFVNPMSLQLQGMCVKNTAYGDFDGDGYNDIVLTGHEGNNGARAQVRVAWSNGNGSFQQPVLLFDHYFYDHPDHTLSPLTGDFNGDGKADIIVIYTTYEEDCGYMTPCATPRYKIFLSNGDGTFQDFPMENFRAQGDGIISWWGYDPQPRFFVSDVNGDGQSDVILDQGLYPTDNGSRELISYLSNGDGSFEERFQLHDANLFPIAVSDVTGDGRGDAVFFRRRRVDPRTFHFDSVIVYKGSTNGFIASSDETMLTTNWEGNNYDLNANLADINGDRLLDLIDSSALQNGYVYIYFSKGDGSFDEPIPSALAKSDDLPEPDHIETGDINGDGYVDILAFDGSAIESVFPIYLSKGDGTFEQKGDLDSGLSKCRPCLVDLSGDGRADLVLSYYCADSIISYISGGQNPIDLLSQIDNGIGYKASISYSNSSKYENRCLPLIVHPIEAITETDGVHSSHTTSYSYIDGYFDIRDREFRGFGTVIESLPNESTNKILYHLDAYRKGRAYQIDRLDTASGSLLSRTSFTWEAIEDSAAPWAFVKLNRKRFEVFASDSSVYSQNDYTYDESNGNVLLTEKTGTGAEKISISNDYANYGTWLWRKTHEAISGEESGVARETEFGYESGTGNLLYKDRYLDGAPYARISYGYDGYGNRTHFYDANGNPPTLYQYDPTATYPTAIINPKGHVVTRQWDYRFGKELWVQDANGQRTNFSYDQFGRLLGTDFPDGGQTQLTYFDYCSGGDCSTVALPQRVLTRVKASASDAVTSLTYLDGLGREVQAVNNGENGAFVVTRTHYDSMGRVAFEAGPFVQAGDAFLGGSQWHAFANEGYATYPGFDYPYSHTLYDKLGRPVEITSRDGQNGLASIGFAYDGYDTVIVDPDQCAKKEVRDHLGRIIEVVEDPNGENIHTSYLYNAAGDLTEVRNALWDAQNPDSNRIIIDFDALGRKIRMDDPDLGTLQYAYDTNGNLTLQTDANGNRIQFSYDELNRLKTRQYPDTGDPTVHLTYDSTEAALCIGRLHSTANGSVTTTVNAYDPMGRTLEVQKSIVGATARTMNWTYDLAGRVQRLTYPHTGASPLFYVDHAFHPGTSLLHTVTGSDGTVYAAMTGYQPSGKIGVLDYGNNVRTTYGYDGWSQRLTSIFTAKDQGAEDTYQNRMYYYSKAGDIEQVDDQAWIETYYYSYDKLHRLTSETTSTGSLGVIPGIYEMQYDNPDHIHAASSVTTSGATTYDYNYDPNGNMTAGPDVSDIGNVVQRSLTFNGDNMPTTVVHPRGGTVNMTYDSEAKRAKKTGPNGSIYYFSDEFEKIGDTETCYIFAGNLRVAMVKDYSSVTYFHKDHLGSSSVMTAENGNAQEQTRYLPFGGKRVEGAGITASNYLFTDQELDAESGLYNYDARLYDVTLGRFLSADSVVPDSYDPQALNRYAYVLNNPLIYIDPSGHDGDVVIIPDMVVTDVQTSFFINDLGDPGFITSWGGAVTIFTPENTTQQAGWSNSTGYYGPPDLFLSAPEFYLEPDFLIGGIYGIARGITKGCIVGLGFKGLKRAASKGAVNFFKNGQIFERTIQTSKGPIDVMAETVINGKTLHLKDIAIFGRDSKPLTGLISEVLKARTALINEAKSAGFQQLRISGVRHATASTSASPGKVVDIMIDLSK